MFSLPSFFFFFFFTLNSFSLILMRLDSSLQWPTSYPFHTQTPKHGRLHQRYHARVHAPHKDDSNDGMFLIGYCRRCWNSYEPMEPIHPGRDPCPNHDDWIFVREPTRISGLFLLHHAGPWLRWKAVVVVVAVSAYAGSLKWPELCARASTDDGQRQWIWQSQR